jgi:hypothetical protein
MHGHEFSAQLKLGAYAWPGGYPRFLVMSDGECLCFHCAKEEHARIRLAAMTKSRDGWAPMAFDVNWESELWCGQCNEPIESAYPSDQVITTKVRR